MIATDLMEQLRDLVIEHGDLEIAVVCEDKLGTAETVGYEHLKGPDIELQVFVIAE